jgi:hypothetical protein
MSRYDNTLQIKTESGTRRAATTIIRIPESESDQYVQIISPERLDKLANEFYGDVTMWWVIAAANGIGKGTFLIPSNTILRIPQVNDINNYIYKFNQSR